MEEELAVLRSQKAYTCGEKEKVESLEKAKTRGGESGGRSTVGMTSHRRIVTLGARGQLPSGYMVSSL